jgi:ribosomal protein L11 methylase PrmA
MNGQRSKNKSVSGWSPTPIPIVTAALEFANADDTDVVYDLGCGDGRVVVRAARMFGARAVGFDIDRRRIQQTRARIRQRGVTHLASVRRHDLLSIPTLHEATLIYLYLPQRAVTRLKPVLRNRCRPGTRIVSVGAWFHSWRTRKELMLRTKKWNWYIGLWKV